MIRGKQYKIITDNKVLSYYNLIIKVTVQVINLFTNKNTTLIRTQPISLKTNIGNFRYDITKFNKQVKNLVDSMTDRNDTTNDLPTKPFQGYQAVSDANFAQ